MEHYEKIRVPRGKKKYSCLWNIQGPPKLYSMFVNVPYEAKEQFKHVGYYEDLNNIRFSNIKEPLTVYSFKELSSGR